MSTSSKQFRLAREEPEAAAELAGLVYVSDDSPGITRRKFGRGFAYYDPAGGKLAKGDALDRVRSLVLPPAYRDVWICPLDNGHLQATGLDDAGRKQYRYHDRWREVRDRAKYAHLVRFAGDLPRVRRAVRRHLRLPGLPREKVLAAVVRLMDRAYVRVGNDQYARERDHLGVTTIRDEHAEVTRCGRVRLEFTGKGGKPWEVDLRDPRLAEVVAGCQELPGQELFAYEDDAAEGGWRDVTSTDVNAYLSELSGASHTAKDFRTWAGTVLAAAALRDAGPAGTQAAVKRNVAAAVKAAAAELGNTPAVCRSSYIHPAVLDAYAAGETIRHRGRRKRGLRHDEADTLALIRGA